MENPFNAFPFGPILYHHTGEVCDPLSLCAESGTGRLENQLLSPEIVALAPACLLLVATNSPDTTSTPVSLYLQPFAVFRGPIQSICQVHQTVLSLLICKGSARSGWFCLSLSWHWGHCVRMPLHIILVNGQPLLCAAKTELLAQYAPIHNVTIHLIDTNVMDLPTDNCFSFQIFVSWSTLLFQEVCKVWSFAWTLTNSIRIGRDWACNDHFQASFCQTSFLFTCQSDASHWHNQCVAPAQTA